MSFLATLAQARLTLTRAQLMQTIGMEVEPGPGGHIRSGFLFGARIGNDGRIGEIWFGYNFPANIDIDGLRIGMGLDALLATCRGFALVKPANLLLYRARGASGEEITAEIRKNRIWMLMFAWPQAAYPQGHPTTATQLPISLCSYQVPCDLLADWAYSFTFTGNEHWAPRVAEWLRRDAEPDGWHVSVSNWNWDHGLEPLLWIARQPACDKATALRIFYWSRPGELLGFEHRNEVPDLQLTEFDITSEIRDRFMRGFYTRSEIAFDATNAFNQEAYLPEDADLRAVERWIPQPMRKNIAGRPEPRSAPGCPL